MYDFDSLFFKEYDIRKYNCLHFTVEVWQKLFNIDLSFFEKCVTVKENGRFTIANASFLRNFKKVKRPVKTPTFCIFNSVSRDELHVGTFIDRSIFHISETGVQYLPEEVVKIGFKEVTYYEYCDDNK